MPNTITTTKWHCHKVAAYTANVPTQTAGVHLANCPHGYANVVGQAYSKGITHTVKARKVRIPTGYALFSHANAPLWALWHVTIRVNPNNVQSALYNIHGPARRVVMYPNGPTRPTKTWAHYNGFAKGACASGSLTLAQALQQLVALTHAPSFSAHMLLRLTNKFALANGG